MGAQFCSQGHVIDIASNIVQYGQAGGAGSSTEKEAACSSNGSAYRPSVDAVSSKLPVFKSAGHITDLFDVSEAAPQHAAATYDVVHRRDKTLGRLLCVRKPSTVERQDWLRSNVRALQAVPHNSGIAKILDVFEDCRALSILTEQCTGGTVYDRLLQRQYVTEQESAVLVQHMLLSFIALHGRGLSHGHPTPDSFRFQSDEVQSSLRLVEFGLDLRVCIWDTCGGHRAAHSCCGPYGTCLQLFETCRIVFCAPEITQLLQPCCGRVGPPRGRQAQEQAEDFGLNSSLQAADMWSVGTIAFLLLCGYPPFNAPSRAAILTRIEKNDFSFDPPFWSKISEEAKDFVVRCLRGTPGRRMNVGDALQHPWIQCLADSSPSGSMLSSFTLNLRRFYRTSLIEAYAANSLAAKMNYGDLCAFYCKCCEVDVGRSGFLTATDLRQILMNLGHQEVAEAIGMCFSRTLRHPGESYLDYTALVESVHARRERLLEEELWSRCREFASASPGAVGRAEAGGPEAADSTGCLSFALLRSLLQDTEVRQALAHDGVEDVSALVSNLERLAVEDAMGSSGGPQHHAELAFMDVAAEVIRHLPQVPPPMNGVDLAAQ